MCSSLMQQHIDTHIQQVLLKRALISKGCVQYSTNQTTTWHAAQHTQCNTSRCRLSRNVETIAKAAVGFTTPYRLPGHRLRCLRPEVLPWHRTRVG